MEQTNKRILVYSYKLFKNLRLDLPKSLQSYCYELYKEIFGRIVRGKMLNLVNDRYTTTELYDKDKFVKPPVTLNDTKDIYPHRYFYETLSNIRSDKMVFKDIGQKDINMLKTFCYCIDNESVAQITVGKVETYSPQISEEEVNKLWREFLELYKKKPKSNQSHETDKRVPKMDYNELSGLYEGYFISNEGKICEAILISNKENIKFKVSNDNGNYEGTWGSVKKGIIIAHIVHQKDEKCSFQLVFRKNREELLGVYSGISPKHDSPAAGQIKLNKIDTNESLEEYFNNKITKQIEIGTNQEYFTLRDEKKGLINFFLGYDGNSMPAVDTYKFFAEDVIMTEEENDFSDICGSYIIVKLLYDGRHIRCYPFHIYQDGRVEIKVFDQKIDIGTGYRMKSDSSILSIFFSKRKTKNTLEKHYSHRYFIIKRAIRDNVKWFDGLATVITEEAAIRSGREVLLKSDTTFEDMQTLTISLDFFNIPSNRRNLAVSEKLRKYVSKDVTDEELNKIVQSLKGAISNLMITPTPSDLGELVEEKYNIANILFAAACTQCRKLKDINPLGSDRGNAQIVVLNTLKRAIMHGFDKVQIFKNEVERGDLKPIKGIIKDEINIDNLKIKVDIDKARRSDAIDYIHRQSRQNI